MKPKLIGDDAWRYFRYAPEIYPDCATCGVVITRIREAFTVNVDLSMKSSEIIPRHPTHDVFICHVCYDVGIGVFDDLPDPCTIEELREATNAEERISARNEYFVKRKKAAAKYFRSERSKKAASNNENSQTKRKAAASGSESGGGGSDKPARKKSGGRRCKKGRITKIRMPKRKKVDSVDDG